MQATIPTLPKVIFRSSLAIAVSLSLSLSTQAKDTTATPSGNTKTLGIDTLGIDSQANSNKPMATNITPIPAQVMEAMQEVELKSADISFIITPLADNKLSAVDLIEEAKSDSETELDSELESETQATDANASSQVATIDSSSDLDLNSDLNTDTVSQPTRINSPVLSPLSARRYQADIPRTPASTMKLIPTFVALDTLGKDFFWMTSAYYTGNIIGNSLYGDLIIRGSGDPKLTHQKIEHLLYQVKQAGIEHIEGDIILDSSIFKNVGKDPAKFDREPLRPYNASPDGLLVNFNSLTIDSYPLPSGHSQLLYTPKLADIELPSSIYSRSGRCSANIARSLAPKWQYNRLSYGKGIPKSCEEYTFYIAYPNPQDFAQQVIKAKWQELGNTLNGQVRNSQDQRTLSPKTSKLSYFYTPYSHHSFSNNVNTANEANETDKPNKSISPYPIAIETSFPLSQQIYDINHYSNNVMTEQLLLSTTAYQDFFQPNGTAKPTTDYPQALSTVKQWWESHLTTTPPNMTNGSGLCRECTLTVANLDELLTYAYQHQDFDSYINSLGVAGISGTIETHKERLPESAAIGRAWIKTGTLGNVTAMAGYVKGKSGQEYSVVGIINLDKNVRNANKYRPVLDNLIDWVAKH